MEEWSKLAAERLSDEELDVLWAAMEREKDLPGNVFRQLELDGAEQAAFDKYLEYFEEAAKRGV